MPSDKRISVLHLLLNTVPGSAPYHELALPLSTQQDITVCSYFPSDTSPPDEITLFQGDGSARGFLRVLRTALGKKRYDILHAHAPHVGVLFLIGNALRFRRRISSTVYTVHSSYSNYRIRHKLMLLPVFASFDRIVCCSRSSYASIPSLYTRLAGDKISVVQNCVNLVSVDRVREIHQGNPAQKGFTVLSVGRLTEVKNPLAVLSAFEELGDENSRLVFVGDGPLRATIVERIKELGLDGRVSLAGSVSRERVYEYMIEADLLVSTSRVEGLPVAVLEAMACRCPVLLSDIPPHREIAGGTAFIPMVRTDDVRGFTERIRAFLTMSPSEREHVGANCRTLVEKRFSLATMHRKYEEVYRGGIDLESRGENVEVQQSPA